ncbi:hypothetical protein CKA32_000944 [Geitlerinema sp. FC II]|nr:hypothetical protein CKA32_000944 [Geitlerinema sp. FC II]
MHLKLACLITKNKSEICIQIYANLIAYLILQFVEIPQKIKKTLGSSEFELISGFYTGSKPLL